MPGPRAELAGRLRYRGGSRAPRLSLLHLKLTDPALRALRDWQRMRGPARPVIAFQGSQGYIKIPCAPGSPGGVRLFAFYLSRYSKDKPQASFDCVRQRVSRLGQQQLDCVGSIQEKITVCATDDSYRLTRERVSQAERAAWSRAAIEIEPAAPGQGQRVPLPKRLGLAAARGACSAGSSASGGRTRSPLGTERRVLVQSLVQLLALRPHCRHELRERLAGAHSGREDGAPLLSALQEVGRRSPRGSSYRLKEELWGQVQADWPGYRAEERQHVRRLLHRNQAHGAVARPFLVPPQCAACQGAGREPRGAKRLALLDASDPRGLERACVPEPGPGSPGSARRLQQPGLGPRSSAEETSEEEGGDDWEEGALRLEQHLSALPESSSRASPAAASAAIPGSCRQFSPIRSAEQRRAYAAAFAADYAEYRRLHARVGNASRRFVQLGAEIKALLPETEEHKAVGERILQEYRRFKETYPGYGREKARCEYLHQKLSHIKSRILEFETSGAP